MEQIFVSVGQKFDGYYMVTPTHDYFFITDSAKKHPRLVQQIEDALNDDGCTFRGLFGTFPVKDLLIRATIEVNRSPIGTYYQAYNDSFSWFQILIQHPLKLFKI